MWVRISIQRTTLRSLKKIMSNIAFTVVQNDMVILELWLSYYRQFFDRIHIIGNGTREQYRDYFDKLNAQEGVTAEILDLFYDDSDRTLGVVRERSDIFHKEHTWVLYSDCDEIVIPDPEKYADLRDFMKKSPDIETYCEGYDIIQVEGEEAIDYNKPYLRQRSYWSRNESYNKPLLSRRPIYWVAGYHKEGDMSDDESKAIKDTGLYLLHLKYSDMSSQRDFGPTITGVHGDVLAFAQENKLKIPEVIRSIF